MVLKSFIRRGSAWLLTAALLISIICLISAGTVNTSAKAFEEIPLENANAVYLYNVENDRILVSQNADVKIQPVSTVKIMAGLICTEMLYDRLDDIVVVTQAMIDGVVGQHFNIVQGHNLSIRDLLYLAFCGGCHRSINILAHVVSGNLPNFITLMNNKAVTLGMNDTFYANATGMHHESMYTTVNDIAKLCLAASENPLLMQITTASDHKTEKLGDKNFVFENRNYLVGTGYTAKYFNSLCHGLAAGSTTESGYCAVTVADNGNLSYICIVMGAGITDDGTIMSYALVNDLIGWAYDAWGYVEIISVGKTVCEMPVTMSLDIDSVLVVPSKSVSAYLPKTTVLGTDITYSHSLNSEELQAPIAEGAHVGLITAYYNGEELATVELVTKTSIAQSEVLYALTKIKEISHSRVFIASVIFAVVFTVVYITVKAIIRGTANNKRYKYR
ncbi:MAG: D-alanyl-D-alanine carboxypeptidase [Clostridia bacterium]|nr:D-alanyl-D-alanine carboxypeptidase [Clostridia bacterium]